MENCLFCDIIDEKKFGAKIYEDENVVAILDKFPNTEWMALVLTKEHHDSYIFDMPEEQYLAYMSSTKKVAKLLQDALNVERVALVMEWMGVNHAHMKLYPLHWLNEKFTPMMSWEREFFPEYKWYISTVLWYEKSDRELEMLANKIRNSDKGNT